MSAPLTREAANQVLLNAAEEFLLLVDLRDLRIVHANRRAEEVLAGEGATLVGRRIIEVETGLADMFLWAEVEAGQWRDLVGQETIYAAAGGRTVAVARDLTRLVDDPQLALLRARDTTKTALADQALERTLSLLAATFESTADGILVIDLEGRIENFNRRFAALMQLPEASLRVGNDRLVYRHIVGMLAKGRHTFFRLARLALAKESETVEVLALTDGRVLECRSHAREMQQQVLGRVFSFSDITERVRQQSEVAKARDEAQAASRAKSEFLATMSHEFRTPMNAILGATTLVLTEEATPELREWADTCRDAAESLLNLVNDILDYAKGEVGAMEFEAIEFSPREIGERVLRLFRGGALEKGLKLISAVAPEVPERLLGDPTRLRQVLCNLASNAIKFTERGRVALSIELQSREHGRATLHFAVTDTGIGIEPEHLERVFEAFRQADASTARRFGGTGLGLPICRQLVAGMGGTLWASSAPDRGSTFQFTLPFAELGARNGNTVEVEARPGLGATTTAPPEPRHLTVLVADDNAVNRRIACRFLEKLGHRSLAVERGDEAVRAAAAQDFDLALLDMNMPGLDGPDVARRIRGLKDRARSRIPLVALSAQSASEGRAECLAAGMDDYLEKPLRLDALASTIAALCGAGR